MSHAESKAIAERFIQALRRSGARDVQYLHYEDAGHGVFDKHREETMPALEEFFARTILN